MEKLKSQDVGFLKLESLRCPFHVAGLMILKYPERAPRNYMRQLVDKCGRLNEIWPVFNKQLSDAEDLSESAWIPATNYLPERHVLYYALPSPGRVQDLLTLVTRAHERPLDRSRPLWEMHVIDGLQGDRFALYCKVHHAAVDGVGAMRMIRTLFSESASDRLDPAHMHPVEPEERAQHSIFYGLENITRGLLKQYQALPELSALLAHMGADALQGKQDAMRLPFTAPRSLFNTELDSRRGISICDLPLKTVHRMARQAGGSINDVLLAICGGALRRYLLEQGALPRSPLVAGVPVSLKSADEEVGNKLSYFLCPFFTNESDDLRRLQRVIRVTREAKEELSRMSETASQDYWALMMAPTIMLTVTGNVTKVRPSSNAIFSNVPGSRQKLYLEGAELDALYPLSIITDGMGLNITVVSHVNRLCFAVIGCPTGQPGIEDLGGLLKQSYRNLRQSVFQ